MRHVQHGNAHLIPKAFKPGEYVLAPCGIQRCQWLVQQEHTRLQGQGAGNGDALALATRKFLYPPREQVPDTQQFNGLLQMLLPGLPLRTAAQPKVQIALHREVLDAVMAQDPERAEQAILKLIDGARDDIQLVLGSRKRLPKITQAASELKAA